MKIKLPKQPPVRFMHNVESNTAFPVFKCIDLPQWKQWGFRCPICGKEKLAMVKRKAIASRGCNCWVTGYYIEL